MDSFAAAPTPFSARAPMKEPSVLATAIHTWRSGFGSERYLLLAGMTHERYHAESGAKERSKAAPQNVGYWDDPEVGVAAGNIELSVAAPLARTRNSTHSAMTQTPVCTVEAVSERRTRE